MTYENTYIEYPEYEYMKYSERYNVQSALDIINIRIKYPNDIKSILCLTSIFIIAFTNEICI